MSINERKDKSGRIKEVDLGLSESETAALKECRAAVASDPELDDMRDATWARYLRHNSWSVAPAIQQMREYLAWRKSSNVDTILDNPDFPSRDIIRSIIPYAYHNFDKEGRPIYMEKTGQIATAALADTATCNPDHLLHSHIYGVEMMQRWMHEESLRRGTRINGICTILDLGGLGFHHRACLPTLKRCLDFDQKYYPEYLGKLYLINSPWVAPYLYQAVQVFLNDVTKSRIQIVAGDPAPFLLQHIDAANLPTEYGGTCTGVACDKGGVGKAMPGLTSCCDVLGGSGLKPTPPEDLQTETVSYDFEKEVSAPANMAANEDALFSWYFDVAEEMDIDFSVELVPASGVREKDPQKRVLIHKTQRLKHHKGTFKAPFPNAKLVFRWDNNFSYFNSKVVRYSVQTMAVQASDAFTSGGGGAGGAGASSSQAQGRNEEQKQGGK